MSAPTQPDLSGHFGRYGGRFVPEALIRALDELDAVFNELAGPDPYDFWRLAKACAKALRAGGQTASEPEARRFYARPYQVLEAGRFAAALREAVTDPLLRRLPVAGAVDQFTDSTDAAGDPGFLRACVDRAHLAERH